MIVKCDFCQATLDTSKDRWLYQDDGSYIHIDCIEPALNDYQKYLDNIMDSYPSTEEMEAKIKFLSKLDSREPFGIEGWHETCEWCGHITNSPHETHVCSERI